MKGWKSYSVFLTLFGVLPIYGSFTIYFIFFIIFQIITIFLFVINSEWSSEINAYGSTGKISEYFQYIMSLVKQEGIICWCFLISKDFKNIFERAFYYYGNLRKFSNKKLKNQALINFKVYSICSILFIANITVSKYFNLPDLKYMFTNGYGLAMLTYEIDFLRLSIFFTFYPAIISTLVDILKILNDRIERVCTVVQVLGANGSEIFHQLVNLLNIRNDILDLCSNNISYSFGLAVAITTAYIMVEFVQAPFYLTFELTDDLHFDIRERFIIGIWFSVKLVVFSRIFNCNDIMEQVSVTAYTWF